jgi:hypothetical protein
MHTFVLINQADRVKAEILTSLLNLMNEGISIASDKLLSYQG